MWEWLLPDLPPGTTIVLDSLNVHRNARVRQVAEAARWFPLFLPACSPDFNRIELVFAQLNTHLRTVAARTTASVIDVIGRGRARLLPAQIWADYRHCAYPHPDRTAQPS